MLKAKSFLWFKSLKIIKKNIGIQNIENFDSGMYKTLDSICKQLRLIEGSVFKKFWIDSLFLIVCVPWSALKFRLVQRNVSECCMYTFSPFQAYFIMYKEFFVWSYAGNVNIDALHTIFIVNML